MVLFGLFVGTRQMSSWSGSGRTWASAPLKWTSGTRWCRRGCRSGCRRRWWCSCTTACTRRRCASGAPSPGHRPTSCSTAWWCAGSTTSSRRPAPPPPPHASCSRSPRKRRKRKTTGMLPPYRSTGQSKVLFFVFKFKSQMHQNVRYWRKIKIEPGIRKNIFIYICLDKNYFHCSYIQFILLLMI